MAEDFCQIVLAAAARPEVRTAVGEIYAEIQQEINRRRPVCVISGRCCRFEEYGHRLFVTTLELACFQHDLGKPAVPARNSAGCPFQIGKLCSVHAIRPMGCRLFFCDAAAQDWQNELYERYHGRLRDLHEALNVPYRYMEWREALAMLHLLA